MIYEIAWKTTGGQFLLTWFLRFLSKDYPADNDNLNYDTLWKLSNVLDFLNATYSKCYAIFKHLALDEFTAILK